MCKDKKFPSFLDSYYWIPQDDSLFTGLLYCGILFGTSILHISNSYSYSFLRRNLMPEGQSCNIGFSKTSPRIERWLSKNNLGETTVQCWVFLGYRNLPGINLFILFPHLEVNAWQVRLLLSYLYLHLHLPPTKGGLWKDLEVILGVTALNRIPGTPKE